ncbi:ATP-binding protein [Leptospira vanthielii]|uniref:GHKL domain protein n=1 Tax=Leptospira vanthielii serovar Holland str. Waz Holland = ATCC 700522 TaxID=1218591 RepID=N1VVA4_9LEPT|nr:ATP-binding protein [Leptospira vanthielii]EMY67889.1 GHKL domain protein [Leptospira vanthielii serovar Holland str. Waz Holland = ATCC 700522]
MERFIITPTVDPTQEFIEIANDFSNPLDLIREAISNAYDANANSMEIEFTTINIFGERFLKVIIKDNGEGMTRQELQSFFDLGNSTKREEESKIGEKGHGTKVYFNSRNLKVTTKHETDKKYIAELEEPFRKLHQRMLPEVKVESFPENHKGTTIEILGYNNNRSERFTHEQLKDYIYWFTKFGTWENQIGNNNKTFMINLKGLNSNSFELLESGHFFPEESIPINDLFDQYLTKAPDYYSKRIIKKDIHLAEFPDIKIDAIFQIEGSRVKYSYNQMLRRSGYQAPNGSYTVQERYGLWLCKDFIPIQRKNTWISYKGSEYTRFHAFVNSQHLRLTANRGSIDNTPSEILSSIEKEVRKIFDDIIESDDWRSISWLEDQALAHNTINKEKKDYEWRIRKVKQTNIAKFGNITLIEPQREQGVYALVIQLLTINPNIFPFKILDFDTHSGIDVIAKGADNTPIQQAKLFYVEFKYALEENFNHSFENTLSVICWDTKIKHDEEVTDIAGKKRKLKVIFSDSENYTKYFLDDPSGSFKIEVYVLKDYLKEKHQLDFRPRNSKSVD